MIAGWTVDSKARLPTPTPRTLLTASKHKCGGQLTTYYYDARLTAVTVTEPDATAGDRTARDRQSSVHKY